ncbi:hypothetical protein [Synoicihabitans lomoniglobus]|uniref:Uncharacterized protein n=1 Tax=Synoicihabitans lomoniglobus TaxID=2909285 RepID=A0AAE9ZUL8_9BACT|nr:hypothetical protein [Opitutaceae bacterium LMO-M01]WED63354.1 hypothetical protein PXH66_13530 [Opitutaceae bacterium LMO-M01]
MNHSTAKAPANPLVLIAVFCSFASVGIVALAFCLLRDISSSGMWAVAAMSAAPSLMGVALAFFITKQPPTPASPPRESL